MEFRTSSKFCKLNFNLKNEIFNFIPVNQIFVDLIIVNKSFNFAIYSKKLFKFIKNNLKDFIRKLNFSDEKIKEIKYKFENFDISEEYIEEICSFILILKFKDKKYLDLKLKSQKALNYSVIEKYISKQPSLLKLHLKGSQYGQLQSEDISKIITGIFKNLNITELSLNSVLYKLEGKYIQYFFELLSKNKKLEKLFIEKSTIGEFEKLDVFSQILIDNNKLNHLKLSGNKFIGNISSFSCFSNALELNRSLKILHLSNLSLGQNKQNFKIFCQALEKNQHIESLNLNNNSISHNKNNFYCLTSLLKKKNNIKKLYLNGNKLENNEGFKFICKAIENNKSLKLLSLNFNGIGNIKDNSKYLSNLIKNNKTLKSLYIADNDLEKDFYDSIRKALVKNNSLREIDMNDERNYYYQRYSELLIKENPGKVFIKNTNNYNDNYNSSDYENEEDSDIFRDYNSDEDGDIEQYDFQDEIYDQEVVDSQESYSNSEEVVQSESLDH